MPSHSRRTLSVGGLVAALVWFLREPGYSHA